MTGPGHYQHAEMLLDLASEDETGSDIERFHLAKAQVHATLALAAATALAGVTLQLPASSRLATAWNEALGINAPGTETAP